MDSIDDLLRRVFQLAEFRPHQREIIQDVLSGHDVVCVMPTGARQESVLPTSRRSRCMGSLWSCLL